MSPRDGCLLTCQWMTGFRISEVLRIAVGTVLKAGEIVPKIGLAPCQMKGGYGKTRWVPVVPKLRRAIERQYLCFRSQWAFSSLLNARFALNWKWWSTSFLITNEWALNFFYEQTRRLLNFEFAQSATAR
jgi:integrase